MVEVSYLIQGIKYNKDGETRFFNKIVGYKVERKQTANEYVSDTVPVQTSAQQQAPDNMPPMPDNEDELPFY